jgi:DNA-directed RNA polymerase specialized sigma24 family protein
MIYQAAIFEDVPMAEPDEIARLRRRDSAALACVVGRYQHRLYRYLRRLVREPAAAAEPDALSAAMASERTAILATEMAGLSAPYREVLTLRFEEGMKLEEIAEVTYASPPICAACPRPWRRRTCWPAPRRAWPRN